MLQEVDTGLRPPHFIALSQIDIKTFLPETLTVAEKPRLFEYVGESVEEGCARASFVVKDLAAQGQYALLGSREFCTDLEQYVAQFANPEEQDAVRYSAVEWFIRRSYHRIQHARAPDTDPVPFARPGSGRRVVTQVFTLFRQVGRVQHVIDAGVSQEQVFDSLAASRTRGNIYDSQYAKRQAEQLQYQQKVTRAMGRVARSKLIYGRQGILREKVSSEKNSSAQREKLLLLSLPGLNKWEFGAVVDYVTLSSNTSRADTGRVPAAIHESLTEMSQRVSIDPDFDEFLDSIDRRLRLSWPSPGDSSVPELPPELEWYYALLRVKCYAQRWLNS